MAVSGKNPSPDLAYCTTPFGGWHQTVQEVVIEVKLEPGTSGKMIKVDFSPSKLKCTVQGETIIEGTLFDVVCADNCVWTVEDRRLLRIQLAKTGRKLGDAWLSLLRQAPDGADTFRTEPLTLHEMRKKLDLEMLQIENPGFDFSGAKMQKNYDEKYKRIAHKDLSQRCNE